MSFFSDKALKELDEIKKRYPTRRAAALPALYVAQKEFGWLSPEAIDAVARHLTLPPAVVKGTATFYSMYKHRQVGRHLIQVCTNVSCMIFGAENLLGLLEEKYGVTPGGTSPDGRFSLVIMECIGACDKAPAMLVDEDFHSDLTRNGIINILESYK
ncbi:MAG: NADH-quinone oxidoreductase subunit NuoE [Nitrospiraceae bacterium]|nr:NADH-quinone oxidoreductase subunit NuoE [Nitrospiraceae bacterium]